MKSSMKKVLVGFLTVLLVGIMVGCTTVTKLPEGVSEDTLKAKCSEVISLLNSKDYAAVVAMGRADFQAQITAEQLEQAFNEILGKAGDFVEITKVATGGAKEKNDNVLAVATVECKYQNAIHNYNISFDKDMTLTGLFVK